MTIIGIDPGILGGIAWHDKAMSALPMPSTERDVSELLEIISHEKQTYAFIEKVHSFPRQGVVSTCTFCKNYGFLRACLICFKIPFEEVPPKGWQKIFGMARSKEETSVQWKNRLKGKAQQLFPHLTITHAIADSLLIAEYGRRSRK